MTALLVNLRILQCVHSCFVPEWCDIQLHMFIKPEVTCEPCK